MFINCRHCNALVATDPATDAPPERCPRCSGLLRGDAGHDLHSAPAQDIADTQAVMQSRIREGEGGCGEPRVLAAEDDPIGATAALAPSEPKEDDGEASVAGDGPRERPPGEAAAPAIDSQTVAAADAPDAEHAHARRTHPPTPDARADAGPEIPDEERTQPSDSGAGHDDERHAGDNERQDADDERPAHDIGDSARQLHGAGHATPEAAAPPPAADVSPGVANATATSGAPVKPAPSFAATHRGTALAGTRSRWLAPALIAGLSLLLLGQILLADRARLSADAHWRPLLSTLCGTLGCALPPWREPAAFRLVSRDVRPHPAQPGVLRATATFRNDARWAQAWPHVVLTLSDVDGRAIGKREFTPQEYLGRSPTENALSSGQSAMIRLDVVEPAASVVAFSFEFH